ncbi:hypothetical protein HYH03_003550 [Edaphochlamys debaryana]|uniref:HYR domain-containing protein n=1 Tax=Edaphochlamys debaryana TaxID=47281 RepID=A0A835YIJ3_9CHLO|nr:hypothetical protein HYH03_003550 [Edaphochlamys debaryana]|eukprot:KAG2498289.1 hypothetical protein HYH03_003550 [Edaphochlamys debaryana]
MATLLRAPAGPLLLLLALSASLASASHFRAGKTTWRTTGDGNLEITLTSSWRTGSSGGYTTLYSDCGIQFTQSMSETDGNTYLDAAGNSYYTLTSTRVVSKPASDCTFMVDDCCRISNLVFGSDGDMILQTKYTSGVSMSPTPTNPAIMQVPKAASGASSSVFVPVTPAPGSTFSCSLVPGGLSSVSSTLSVATETGGCRVSWANSALNAQDKAPVTLRITSGTIYTDTDFILEIANASPGSPPSTVVTANGAVVAQGSTLEFAVGTTYTVTFTTTDPDEGATLSGLRVGSLPAGATLTGLSPGSSPLISTFTWTPTAINQIGTVQVLFSDQTNKQTTASFAYASVAPAGIPVVTVPADITEEANVAGGRVVVFEASATDDKDESVALVCVPASGATFPVGTTTVTCTAGPDTDGNTGTASFHVTITDKAAPTFIDGEGAPAIPPADMTIEATCPDGAPATIKTPRAADTEDPSPTVVCERLGDGKALTDLFPLGATVVTCTAKDRTGNAASVQFTVTVVDKIAPVIGVPAPNVFAEGTSESGAEVSYTVTVADLVTPRIEPSCTPASGSVFPFGSTTVTCTAKDAAGNTNTATFLVTVTNCAFSGFRPPVENPPLVNLVSTQQNLPLKWGLGGYFGMNILAPGYPRLVAVACGSFTGTVTPAGQPWSSPTPATSFLKYDTTESRYMIGYDLKGRTVINTCYQLQLQFTTCPNQIFMAYLNAIRNK